MRYELSKYKKDSETLSNLCNEKNRSDWDKGERLYEMRWLHSIIDAFREGHANNIKNLELYTLIDKTIDIERNYSSNIGQSREKFDPLTEKLKKKEIAKDLMSELYQGKGKYKNWLLLAFLGEAHPDKAAKFYKEVWPDGEPAFHYEKPLRFRWDRSKGSELSPRNPDFIPFVRRTEEIKKLDEFANHKDPFKLWAIVGPSGSGKTRLTFHWGNRGAMDDWDAILLRSDDKRNWSTWPLKNDTLIVIDYIYGFDSVIAAIINRFKDVKAGDIAHKVRLLILDHSTPEKMSDLLKDPRLGKFDDMEGSNYSLIKKLFFDPAPMNLTETVEQDHIIEKILCKMTGKDSNDGAIREA